MYELIKRDDYFGRNLYFYLSKGGVYNDIIAIIDKMRKDSIITDIPQTTIVLNEASYWRDRIRFTQYDEKTKFLMLERNNSLSLCVLACLAPDDVQLVDGIKKRLKDGDPYYESFKELIEKLCKAEKERNIPFIEKVNEELIAMLRDKDETIDRQKQTIVYQNQVINDYFKQLKKEDEPNKNTTDEKVEYGFKINRKYGLPSSLGYVTNYKSEFDRSLTLNAILNWVREHKYYELTKNVFHMLSDLMLAAPTDKEDIKSFRDVENEILENHVTQNVINEIYTKESSVFTGIVKQPQFKSQSIATDELIESVKEAIRQLNNGK